MARKSNRANGMGTLEKRGKIYLARWTFNGKHFSKSTRCTDKKAAEKALEEIIVEFKKSKNPHRNNIDNQKVQIKDLYEIYRSDISLNPITESTESLYIGRFKQFQKYCEERNIILANDFSKTEANDYLSFIKHNVKSRTYNQIGVFFRAVFNSVMKVVSLSENPFSDFKKLQVDKSNTRRILTEDELKNIHEVVDSMSINWQILFYMAEYQGMRCSDIACCKWQDVDLEQNIITYLPLKTKKNGKIATVPLHPNVHSLLMKKLNSLNESDEKIHVLPEIFNLYKKGNLHNYTTKIFKKANIKTFSYSENGHLNIETGFHALRHTFASKCAKNGVPIHHIQTMLGHSTPLMSLEYTHTNIKDLKLPKQDNDSVSCKIKKSIYRQIEALRNKNETFDECLERILEEQIKSLNDRSRNLMNIDDLQKKKTSVKKKHWFFLYLIVDKEKI